MVHAILILSVMRKRGESEVFDRIGDRIELAARQDPGPGLDPSQVIGEPQAIEKRQEVEVAIEDDVIVPVPGHIPDLPCRDQPAELVRCLDDRDFMATVSEP